MQTISLVPHPKAPPVGVRSIQVDIGFADGRLNLRYEVQHNGVLKIPSRNGRLDELWKTTCFELFARDWAGPRYVEYNLAPDDAWAAYQFTGERQGMADLATAAPIIRANRRTGRFALSVSLDAAALPAMLGPISLSAVIEERDGTSSYWAIVHPDADAFDFHHPACFVLDLPRPDADAANSLPK